MAGRMHIAGSTWIIGLGEQVWGVQCKHWKTWKVNVGTIRELVRAMADHQMNRGVMLASNGFTDEARELAGRHNIELLDAAGFVKLLEKADAAYDPEFQSLLKDRRKFCPKCESEMVLKTAEKGRNAGSQFWSCSRFPKCWGKIG